MIEIIDDEGRILGLVSDRFAMPVRRRHGDTLRVWLRKPLLKVTDMGGAAVAEDIAAWELYFRWHEVRRPANPEWGRDSDYISRWYLKPVEPITDEQWKTDPGCLVRIKWK